MYYVLWPHNDRQVTILSRQVQCKDAYGALDLLGDVRESLPDGLKPYVVDQNHLPQHLPPPPHEPARHGLSEGK